MLARIGNKLYWAGRYLEQAEQMASYTRVHYLASMDAPSPAFKTSLWEFLLQSTQSKQAYFRHYRHAEEEKVLHFIALEEANPASIFSTVTKARELARGARDCISAGLWEHINCFYHAINNYTAEKLAQKSFCSFAQKVEKYSYTIKGYINSIMIRNEEWKMLSMGYHLERALQLNTMLLSKMHEISTNISSGKPEAVEYYHMKSMLEGIDAYEMYKQHYKTNINRSHFIHFLVFNSAFPKSIAYNLNQLFLLCQDGNENSQLQDSTLMQQIESMTATIGSINPEALEGNELPFLESNLKNLQQLAETLEMEQPVY
ncbi:alpha-E domain-containing protein [Cesiribacter sp. SM1]|uniref:alpha-E domain-containing protein n=1 Tax=Cesiribacter sp. SM1 TaxID=2861196 RepID=UPI001CD7A24C|nr:alpha-E domain-containing protein [Cesiribacter sp. SM1]